MNIQEKQTDSVLDGLAPGARDLIRDSLSPATQRAYAGAVRRFQEYAGNQGVTVVDYLTHRYQGGTAPGTLYQEWSGLQLFMTSQGNTPTPELRAVVSKLLKGCSNQWSRGGGYIRPKTAIVAGTVKDMVIGIDSRTAKGCRDKALLLLGFSGMFRRSELVALNVSDIAPAPEDGLYINVRRSKTDQSGKGLVKYIGVGSTPRTCPVHALKRLLVRMQASSGAVFQSIRKNGKYTGVRLSNQSVARVVKKHAGDCGLNSERYAGHSLRSGGITTAAQAGESLG